MTADEEKISSLYQQGKDQEPPAHLDNAILNAAHEAVGHSSINKSSKDRPTTDTSEAVKSPFSGGWPAIASIAAVLIITVILVPLINKETPPPATSRFADETQELMLEQDSFTRMSTTQDDIAETREEKVEARKRSQAEAPAASLPERQLMQAPQEPTSPTVLDSGKAKQAKQITSEESMSTRGTTMDATIQTPAPARPATPASEMMKSTIMQEREAKLEAEPIQRTSSGLMADKDASIILPADEWLKKIRQLIDQGDLNLAKQELDKFKRHYPDEAVDQLMLNQLKNQ